MVYKRKSEQHKWTANNMQQAIEAVRAKEMGLKRASHQFGVPCSTLQRRCRKDASAEESAVKTLGRFRVAFTPLMEMELVKHVKDMDAVLFGFTAVQLRKIAFEFAELNNIEHQFNREKKEAGKQWLRCFLSRHSDELSLRMPETTSAARARAFNEVSVSAFFDILEKLQDEKKFTPDRIFNVDETGIYTVPNKPSRIIAPKGKKQVGCLSSAERGQLVTAKICMSAAGEFVPPRFIFPRKRKKDELMNNAPPGAIAVPHDSGWMQSELFVKWFQHFMQHANPSRGRPVLLILDGHKTYEQSALHPAGTRQQCEGFVLAPALQSSHAAT